MAVGLRGNWDAEQKLVPISSVPLEATGAERTP